MFQEETNQAGKMGIQARGRIHVPKSCIPDSPNSFCQYQAGTSKPWEVDCFG
jgi:hypothetical protein